MLTLPTSLLSGMLLLADPSPADTMLPLPVCEVGTRHVELTADASSPAPEICIRPDLALDLFFDTKVALVEVEGRERFRRVDEGATSLVLIASEALHDGDRIRVTVSFQSQVSPTSATFILVLHPSTAERQVEVSRHERTEASYKKGEQQARAEVQQCRAEKARLQADCGGRGGLTELILHGRLGKRGVVARKVSVLSIQPQDRTLDIRSVISYRAIGSKNKGRIAVEVNIHNKASTAWTPAGASLMGSGHEQLTNLQVSPLEPIPPGKEGRLIIETDAEESEAQDAFTLKLWDTHGHEGVLLGGVTFP